MGENGGCYGGNSGDGYFAREGGVSQDLRGGVEVAEGVGGYYHDCFLRVARGYWVVMGGVLGRGGACLWERVGEEEFGQFALAKGDEVGLWGGGVSFVLFLYW